VSLINSRTEKIIIVSNYGIANLAALKNDGYNIDGLNNAEKAKIIYLTHHLGLANARRFIKNEITEESAWELLKAQIGRKPALSKAKQYGSYIKAHRMWLSSYIYSNIKTSNYFCPEMLHITKIEDIELSLIFNKI
jgi:hypothetical protein